MNNNDSSAICTLSIEKIQRTLSLHHYDLKQRIGGGSFGSVFVVFSQKYSQSFVVKVMSLPTPSEVIPNQSKPLRPTCDVNCNKEVKSRNYFAAPKNLSASSDLDFESFEKNSGDMNENYEVEIETLMNLSHPNIISMYDYFKDDQYFYVILEYCTGGSLIEYMKIHGMVNAQRFTLLAKSILSALQKCHEKNIAHRDIKPANILIDKYGRPKLADFGISQIIDMSKDAKDGPIKNAGSLPYMSPESQASNRFDLKKSDVWSLGITLYVLAIGNLPWATESYAEMKFAVQLGMVVYPNSLNQKIVQLLKKMLVTNPNKRASVEDLLKDPLFATNNMPLEKTMSSSIFADCAGSIIQQSPIPMMPTEGRKSGAISLRPTFAKNMVISRRKTLDNGKDGAKTYQAKRSLSNVNEDSLKSTFSYLEGAVEDDEKDL